MYNRVNLYKVMNTDVNKDQVQRNGCVVLCDTQTHRPELGLKCGPIENDSLSISLSPNCKCPQKQPLTHEIVLQVQRNEQCFEILCLPCVHEHHAPGEVEAL